MKMTWYERDIKNLTNLGQFVKEFKNNNPIYGAFDTETNGLNIVKHKPFLLVFGFINLDTKTGYTYSLDLELTNPLIKHLVINTFINHFEKLEKVIGHNIKYDLHMMSNIGFPDLFKHNTTDTQIYIRLAHDAIPARFGGVSMSLKSYAKKYIDPNATSYERILSRERLDIRSSNNKILQQDLFEETGKKYPLYAINEMLKDKVVGIDNLPKKIQEIITKWIKNTPDPDDYSNLNRENVTRYAHKDVVYTLETFLLTMPVAIERKQQTTIRLEEELIRTLYSMERVGFAFNKPYMIKSQKKLKEYILDQRKLLASIIKSDITVGQHEEIKKLFAERYNVHLPSTGAKVIENMTIENKEANRVLEIIAKLRTLEKWYSTYILKWLESEVDGRIYTTIHQTGAVSGRVSSDFQQFPKSPIVDEQGNELFHPRKMVKISGNGYNSIAYIDYSQIELRFQAFYTILVNGGDKNLCRAYMPFECTEIDGEWYLNEDLSTKWHPTDLHGLTTKIAFGVTETDPEWSKLRHIGKTVNFACNYGSTDSGLEKELGFTKELAQKLYKAYLEAFAGLQPYREYVRTILSRYPYIEDLFGRKFYGANAHKASNYIVQGSAADFLKKKMIEIHKFLEPYKTRFQMNIHDEMSFEMYEGEEFLIPKLKSIMEQLEGTLVPIVADTEITYTTWDRSEKYDPNA